MKPKSLPTLELLAVFLAIKCLLLLLNAYSRIKIRDILISVAAQDVLSWLVFDNIKTKNEFVKNRLKDMIGELKEKKSLSAKFKYVHTEQNSWLPHKRDNPAKILAKSSPLDLRTWMAQLKSYRMAIEWTSVFKFEE